MVAAMHRAKLAGGNELLRIARRPAIRLEVANVNMPVGSQATLRVGHVVVAGG